MSEGANGAAMHQAWGAAETEQDQPNQVWPPPNYRTGDDVLDAPVQITHLDAAGAKRICADLGYFEDRVLRKIVGGRLCGTSGIVDGWPP